MANENVLKFILLKNSIIDIKDCSTRITKNKFDFFLVKAADNNFCARNVV
jgi:hypothetical protein